MKTVVIAAGHSNTDSGAVNGEHKESVLMASFRNAVAVYLRANGIRVVTDGTGLVNKPLKESISLIKGSDLAIELTGCELSAFLFLQVLSCNQYFCGSIHKSISNT